MEIEPLHRQGPHYDAQSADLTQDIPFYVDRAQAAGGPVLEVGCGTGRLSIPIAQAGMEVVGVDISPSMLTQARGKAAALGLDIEWVEADWCDVSLGRRFALVVIPYNALQLFLDHQTIHRALAHVRAHLVRGGRLIFDVFNPDLNLLAESLSGRPFVTEYAHPETGQVVRREDVQTYDDATQTIRLTMRYPPDAEGEARVETLEMRCLFPQELDAILEHAGFRVVEKLGDFDGSPFRSGAPKQICVCEVRE